MKVFLLCLFFMLVLYNATNIHACSSWNSKHVSDKHGIPNYQICGGFARSTSGCVTTGSSQYCSCREGFTGDACEQVLCAHANGAVCNSNGYCDRVYNNCVCREGYIGVACEIKLDSANPCSGNGQQITSYPLPSYAPGTDYNIPLTVNLKVDWL